MRLTIGNRQRRVKLNLPFLRRAAAAALPLCVERKGPCTAVLPELAEVEVTVLSDRRIAAVNEQFLAHEGPTDVITFDHGEILIGAETARAQASRFGKKIDEEVALYLIHGLLHLNGWSDSSLRDADLMRGRQEEILRTVLTSVRLV